MTLEEARELLVSPIWPHLRDYVSRTGKFDLYQSGDFKRMEYLDDDVRKAISLWVDAVSHIDEWRKVVDGAKVREIRAAYPGVYPEVLKFAPYFKKGKDPLPVVLKLKFPEVYALCCS